MVHLIAQEIGSLKKPAWLLEYLRGNHTEEEKKEATDEAALVNIKLLENVGLDLVYDGEVRRVEMYEYPIKRIGGFELAGTVRSWDNKYYKKARVVNKVEYLGNYHMEEFSFVRDNTIRTPKIPITGAYTLMDWSYNEAYESRDDLAMDLAKKIVNRLLVELEGAGAKVVQIDEPAATTHPSEMGMFLYVFNEQVKGVGLKVHTHICYSGDEYASLMPIIPELKAVHFALEFANRDGTGLGTDDESRPGYKALKAFKEYGTDKEIGVGVIDVHTDFIEPPELVRDRILYAVKIIGDPSRVYVNPDCGLRTRSRAIALKKLKSMIAGKIMAEKELK